MLRVVLPIASAAPGRLSGWAVATVGVIDVLPVIEVLSVAVVDEVVVVIDIDVIVATPSATVTPAAAPSRPHRYTYTKRDRHAGRVISYRRIVYRG